MRNRIVATTPLEMQRKEHTSSLTGFTFIELLVVVVIISIVVGVSMPQFKTTAANIRLDSFVKDIYYLSLYLQETAIAEGKIYCLNYGRDDKKIWATLNGTDGFTTFTGRFGKKYPLPDDISLSTNKTEIYFYPDGSIDDTSLDQIELRFENQENSNVTLIMQGASGALKVK